MFMNRHQRTLDNRGKSWRSLSIILTTNEPSVSHLRGTRNTQVEQEMHVFHFLRLKVGFYMKPRSACSEMLPTSLLASCRALLGVF